MASDRTPGSTGRGTAGETREEGDGRPAAVERPEGASDGGDVDTEALLAVLGDERSVALIGAIKRAEAGVTARELAERASIPTSTVYRKMDAICATPLVEGAVALVEDGPQTTRYHVTADEVTVSFGDGVAADVRSRDDG